MCPGSGQTCWRLARDELFCYLTHRRRNKPSNTQEPSLVTSHISLPTPAPSPTVSHLFAEPPPSLAPSHHPLPHPATCSRIHLAPSPSPCPLFLHPPPLPLPRGWPCALGGPSATPNNGPGGGRCVSPLRRVVSVFARLSPPVLRSGLRWLRGSGDDPVGCG